MMLIMTSRRIRSAVTAVIVSVGLLSWIAAPIVGLWMLGSKSQAVSLTSPVSTWVPVEQAQGELRRTARVDLTWGDEVAIYAPSWSGTVQTVHVRKGMAVKSGDPIVTVDGVVRQAWSLSVPLYRSVSRDDAGPDVAAVNQLLSAQGLPATTGDKVGRDSIAGFREFAARIGVPNAKEVTSFDPGWVIYLPAENAVISVVEVAPSVPAPTPGEKVLGLGVGLERAALRTAAAEGEELYVAGQPLAIADDRTSIDAASLLLLKTLVEPEAEDVNGSLRVAIDGEWSVPTGSLLPARDGGFCIVVQGREDDGPVPVEFGGGESGSAIVRAAIDEDDFVLVGPDLGEYRCRS